MIAVILSAVVGGVIGYGLHSAVTNTYVSALESELAKLANLIHISKTTGRPIGKPPTPPPATKPVGS